MRVTNIIYILYLIQWMIIINNLRCLWCLLPLSSELLDFLFLLTLLTASSLSSLWSEYLVVIAGDEVNLSLFSIFLGLLWRLCVLLLSVFKLSTLFSTRVCRIASKRATPIARCSGFSAPHRSSVDTALSLIMDIFRWCFGHSVCVCMLCVDPLK